MLTSWKAAVICAGVCPAAAIFFLAGSICQAMEVTGSSSVNITTNYYIFGGTNRAQLLAAMAAARPWKGTRNYDAQTKWSVYLNYGYGRSEGQFKLNWVEVKTRVAITLPRWIPGHPVTPELVAQWTKCSTGLRTHERGHLQVAQAATEAVKKHVLALPGCDSVEELVKLARETMNNTLEEFHERERKYDEVTGHGRTQGAVLPMWPFWGGGVASER
jgi:predicted secreted Zn-dependent protease